MSYELNARICLPAAMNSSQICELNVGRFNSSIAAFGEKNDCEQHQPNIVSYVVSALAQYFEAEDGSDVMFSIEYFIRAT